jgi:hypothetical protein
MQPTCQHMMETRLNPLSGIVSQDRHPGLPGATASRDTACLLRAPSRGVHPEATGPRKSTEAASRERRASRTRRAGQASVDGCLIDPCRQSEQARRAIVAGMGVWTVLGSRRQPNQRYGAKAAIPGRGFASGQPAGEREAGEADRASVAPPHRRSVAGRGFPSDAERGEQVPPLGRLRLYREPGAVVTGARVQPPPGISVSIRS